MILFLLNYSCMYVTLIYVYVFTHLLSQTSSLQELFPCTYPVFHVMQLKIIS